MLSMLLLVALAVADEKDGFYALPDAGVTLAAPNWHMSRWSDWDWKGRTLDNASVGSVWHTPFQLDVSEGTRDTLIAHWTKKLSDEERGENIVFSAPTFADESGKRVMRAQASFKSGDTKAVFFGAAFAAAGKTVHFGTYAAAGNASRAQSGIDGLVAKAAIQNPPGNLSELGGKLSTKAASIDLPAGWRRPLAAEQADVEAMYSRTLVRDTALCSPAIYVAAPGEADLALLCDGGPEMGIVDAYSFADDAHRLAGSLFGKAADKLPPAESVTSGTAMAALIHVNDGLYVAALPMQAGSSVLWLVGRTNADPELATAAKSMIGSWALEKEHQPNPAFGAVMAHALTYNPTHPAVLAAGALFFAILAGFGVLVFRQRPAPEAPTY